MLVYAEEPYDSQFFNCCVQSELILLHNALQIVAKFLLECSLYVSYKKLWDKKLI